MEPARRIDGDERDDGPSTASLDHLYRRHRSWLADLARRRLRVQAADAEDIVQDAYLRLAQTKAKTVRRPKALLAQIALNLFRDGKRRDAVRSRHKSSITRADGPERTMLSLTEQEAKLELERLILALPEPQRDVFVLSRFRNMSNADIAAHLGVSIKTVEWRMSRALDFCISRLRD